MEETARKARTWIWDDECDRPARKGSAAWTLAQARRDGEVRGRFEEARSVYCT